MINVLTTVSIRSRIVSGSISNRALTLDGGLGRDEIARGIPVFERGVNTTSFVFLLNSSNLSFGILKSNNFFL